MPEEFAIKSIESKYKKSFHMISSHFSGETGNYQMMVSPEDNPDLVFALEHNPKTNHVNDFYPYAKWQYEASDYFHDKLDIEDVDFVLSVGVKYAGEFDPLQLESFEELLASKPDRLNLNFFMHIFEKLEATSCRPILALDEQLRAKGLKKVGLSVSFYDPSMIPPIEEHPPYGFNAQAEDDFEKLHAEAFLGIIKYRIDNAQTEVPSTAQLIEIVVDKANSMKFYQL